MAFEDLDKNNIKSPKFVAERYDSLPPSSGFEAIAYGHMPYDFTKRSRRKS